MWFKKRKKRENYGLDEAIAAYAELPDIIHEMHRRLKIRNDALIEIQSANNTEDAQQIAKRAIDQTYGG